MSIGSNIRRYREKVRLSVSELAHNISVDESVVASWEAGEAEPALEELLRVKDALGVTLDELVCKDGKVGGYNADSLDTICAALAYAMGIEAPSCAAPANAELTAYIDRMFDGEKADRIVMYNPDAVAEWIYDKYPEFFRNVIKHTDKEIFLRTVMPSVTPVCFGTMYTGAQPAVHGIQRYEKPIIRIDTLFDALIRAGKKPALITYENCSLSKIYLDRDMDYYHFQEGNPEEANAKAAELILRDEYDFILIYNGNYDFEMHKSGPESYRSLAELRLNDHAFAVIANLIEEHWKGHNTLLGFAMDHGCHEIDGGCGSHGLDMPEDLNIVHRYKCYKKR